MKLEKNGIPIKIEKNDIDILLQIAEAFFDGTDPEDNIYMFALKKVFTNIYPENHPFWSEIRLEKLSKIKS